MEYYIKIRVKSGGNLKDYSNFGVKQTPDSHFNILRDFMNAGRKKRKSKSLQQTGPKETVADANPNTSYSRKSKWRP